MVEGGKTWLINLNRFIKETVSVFIKLHLKKSRTRQDHFARRQHKLFRKVIIIRRDVCVAVVIVVIRLAWGVCASAVVVVVESAGCYGLLGAPRRR